MVKYIGPTGNLIDGLLEQYNNNNIEALCICIMTKAGDFHIGWDSKSKFIDRIGMATVLTHDLYESTKG